MRGLAFLLLMATGAAAFVNFNFSPSSRVSLFNVPSTRIRLFVSAGIGTKQECYQILGVSWSANLEEIKAAYRKLAKMYHPDANPDIDTSEKFKEINRAYELLKEDIALGNQGMGRSTMETWDGTINGPTYDSKTGFGSYSVYKGASAPHSRSSGTNGGAYSAATGSSAGAPYRSGSGFGQYNTHGGNSNRAGSTYGRQYTHPRQPPSGVRSRNPDTFFDRSRVGSSAAHGSDKVPPPRRPIPGPTPRGYNSFYNEHISSMGTDVYGKGVSRPQGPVGRGMGAGYYRSPMAEPRGTIVDGTNKPSGPVVIGNDVKLHLETNFKTGVFGGEVNVTVNRLELCGTCNGIGAKPGSRVFACTTCGGAKQTPTVNFQARKACPTCDGTGIQIQQYCSSCNGQGRRNKTKQVTVKIPRKFEGEWIRIPGEGDVGPHGGPAGDLYVYPKVDDFEIENKKEARKQTEGGFLLRNWRRVKNVVTRRKSKRGRQLHP